MANMQNLIWHADEHTRTVQAWLASRSPAGKQLSLSTVHASSTGLQIQFLNLALGNPNSTNSPEAEIIKDIEQVVEFFSERNVPWYWMYPSFSTLQIGKHLEHYGLTYDLPDLPAMIAPLPAPRLRTDPTINVWLAANKNDLMAASKIRRTAFRFPENAGTTYFEDMDGDWLRNENVYLYLASIGSSIPAAIGALIIRANLPGVYVMATLPEYERKGLGRAILNRIMTDAEEMGFSHIVLTASTKGFPLYQKFGFEHAFDYIFYSIA